MNMSGPLAFSLELPVLCRPKFCFFSCSGLIGCSDGFTKELLQNTLGTDFAEESYARPVPKGSRSCCLVYAFTDGHH